jgi:hypothetical protein
MRRWIPAWGLAAVIGVANGVVREATYGKRLSEERANQLSGVTAAGALAGLFYGLERRWPIPWRAQACQIGAAWLAMTVAFEFGFGRLVAKQSWAELLDDYDVTRGRTWPYVVAWIAIGPAVVSGLDRRTSSSDT